MVLLATGTGKSLIYQLPAMLYRRAAPCITLVVSPLVSLMEDQVYIHHIAILNSTILTTILTTSTPQVTGLPSFLKAAALHYNMTAAQKAKVTDQVKSGRLDFLLVSPEAVAGGGGAFGQVHLLLLLLLHLYLPPTPHASPPPPTQLLPHLPPIAFVCIDEAHCVSHWSHNFRPSYLRLARIIREKLGVATILGLTATAPESITRSLGCCWCWWW